MFLPASLMRDHGVSKCLVCTYQAISGAGKTRDSGPKWLTTAFHTSAVKRKKRERALKLWGHIENGQIVPADKPSITAQCLRVACSDGHMAAVFVSFDKKPTMEEIKEKWAAFSGSAQELKLPSAPKQFLHYFEEADRPQTKLDRNLENGMAVSIGRLRPDTQYDYKLVYAFHITRSAAPPAVRFC